MPRRKLSTTESLINGFLDLPTEEAVRLHQFLGVTLARRADAVTPKGIKRGTVAAAAPAPPAPPATPTAPARRRRRVVPDAPPAPPAQYGDA